MRPTPTGTDDALKSSVSLRPHGCSRHIGLGLFGVLATVAWAQGQGLLISDPLDIVASDQAPLVQLLDEARPAPVTPEAKAMVLKSLPTEGEIAAHAYGQSTEWATPGELLTTDSKAFVQWLETARPAPLTAQARAHVLSVLPPEGEITRLNGSGRRKVAAVSRLLQVMGRDLTHEIKIVEAPILRVGVYERTVILITETALTLLEAEELQAFAAHEIGHEYFTAQYERASELKDKQRLKELELLCDAVALVTLERLYIDPSRLMSAVEKGTRYNRQHFGDAVDESGYPTLSQRWTFAREVIEWFARGR